MSATVRLVLSPLSLGRNATQCFSNRHLSSQCPSFPATSNQIHKSNLSCSAGGNGGDGIGRGISGGGGGGGGGRENSDDSSSSWVGPIGAFMNGWRSRVAKDPQFPFKVIMEQLVGVSACLLGDMASRPNFGLNELDLVFSTLVVGSILNFLLMYLLAPTTTSAASSSSAFPSHMFEPGSYGLINRFGTLVYKGVVFAAVGFAAGLVGTSISNGLIKMRKKMDPNFESPNKAPPTLLNSATWALHMGLSSNIRYQTLNGVEFLLAKALPGAVFRTSVVVLRCLNNVLGGVSFVVLARLTGSQSVEKKAVIADKKTAVVEEEKLLRKPKDSLSDESA